MDSILEREKAKEKMKCPNCKKAELELIYYGGNPDLPMDVCPLCGYCLNVFNMERDFLDELYWEDTEGFRLYRVEGGNG